MDVKLLATGGQNRRKGQRRRQDVGRQPSTSAWNETWADDGNYCWKSSMRKIPVICSLLVAFGLSAIFVGCDAPKPVTKTPGKSSGAGSTTGGGAEVPAAPKKGAVETPAKPAEEAPKTGDETPKTDLPETGDAPKN